MKRVIALIVVLCLVTGVVAASQPDPIREAMLHAEIDSADYRAAGWGSLAFLASVVLSPLFGGGGVIVAANVVEPSVSVPPARLAEAQRTWDDSGDIMLYQAQYRQSMTRPIQRSRSRRAWIGTGIGFGVNVVLISMLLAGY